jgi:DNA-damage-inducible protein D
MNIFDSIKRADPEGREYWSSRELAKVLEYADYRNFEDVIVKAKVACKNSLQAEEDHFVDVTEMIELAKGAQRQITSVFLSRYACYLIVQSADPKKEMVFCLSIICLLILVLLAYARSGYFDAFLGTTCTLLGYFLWKKSPD